MVVTEDEYSYVRLWYATTIKVITDYFSRIDSTAQHSTRFLISFLRVLIFLHNCIVAIQVCLVPSLWRHPPEFAMHRLLPLHWGTEDSN